MAVFEYKAKNAAGEIITGRLNSDSKNEAAKRIRDQGLFPVDLNDMDSVPDTKSRNITIGNRIKKKQVAIFVRQFASMLQAGIPLPVILEVLLRQEKNPNFKKILETLNTDILSGYSLSSSMSKFKVFPNLLISMVEVGEVNGRLDVCMERVADNLERELKLSSKIKGAMIYPSVLLFVTIAVVIILNFVVLPTFVSMFNQMGAKLPKTTMAIIALSNFIKEYWYIILLVLALLGFIVYRLFKEESSRRVIDRFSLKLPIIGRTLNAVIMARFCRTFSSMVEGGVEVIAALRTTRNVLGNRYVRDCFDEIIRNIQTGASISTALSVHSFFDPLVVKMVQVGEESGLIGDVMGKTATLYEDESESRLQKMVSLVEPMITIIMALAVGFVVLSIVPAMFQMYNLIGQQ